MKPLIAIITCHKFKSRANAQRSTWIKNCKFDYKFFLGKSDEEPASDEVYLDVPDNYVSLALKVQAACKWAVDKGYDAFFKCDDDTYIFPDRLEVPSVPYTGRINDSNYVICPLGWCSGFAYWLTGEALTVIANEPTPTETREDLWVGKTMSAHKIKCIDHEGMIVLSLISPQVWCHFGKQAVAVCEFPEDKMLELHDLFTNPARANELKSLSKLNPRFGIRTK